MAQQREMRTVVVETIFMVKIDYCKTSELVGGAACCHSHPTVQTKAVVAHCVLQVTDATQHNPNLSQKLGFEKGGIPLMRK